MYKSLKILGAAVLFAAAGSAANAAPVSTGQVSDALTLGVNSGLIQVHGDHRSCARDRRGWHRHSRRYGDRRSCRRWSGRGRRPDACVRFGPIWYCDY
jgi:hypothetical protein